MGKPKPKREFVPCPHDINVLLQTERQYIPYIGTAKGGRVWCNDCWQWVPFDFVEREDGKGMSVTQDREGEHG